MIYSTKLTSGETILSEISTTNDFHTSLINPLIVSVVNGQLQTMPWPEFLKSPVHSIEINNSTVVYSNTAEDSVLEQYDRVSKAVYGD